ncbi:YjgN family protein [soil metagenome]|mgnify:FL=1
MQDEQHSAFAFHGSWREYAPIAFTNLLLTIVTLGIYRFWATTRTRRYLWAQTRFIDDRLEWTGTGKELFVGFLLVLVLFGIPFIFLQFGAQALIFQGYPGVAAALGFVATLFIFYLVGIARYRALRYRLSRSYWHGIRGGSDDQGWSYGLSYMGKTFVGYIALGLLIPWAMMSLWNQRWSAMSFGPFQFRSDGNASATMKRFLLFYILPFVIAIAGGVVAMSMMPSLMNAERSGSGVAAGILAIFLLVFGFYILLGLIALAFYAKFFRVAVGGLALSDLDFQFTASTKQWLKLFLGDVALVICTLGIGAIFLTYRHWAFFIRHMEATGEIDLNRLTQSTTRTPGQGEGLLDAFDVGAI